MCIVCRCDVADWIPKIGHENMALLLERAAWSCNVTKLWWYCNCAESGKPFPQQFSLPKTPAKGTHTLGSPLCLGETSLASTYTSPTRLNTFTPPDDLVHIQKKKKEARSQGSYSALAFRRSSGPELVTWQILVNGFASRARLSQTLLPPYTFGSMSVRWIHLLSQVLSGTLNAVV